jgi:chorismate mutase
LDRSPWDRRRASFDAGRGYCAARRNLYGPAAFDAGVQVDQETPSLDEVRTRIDEIDAELLRLVDARAGLAGVVADAKRAAGDGGKFGLRPAREAQLLRKLLAHPRKGASDALTVRLWRELISDSLFQQGPFHLSVWAAGDAAPIVEFARFRFGSAPPLARAARPEEALAAAKTRGGVAVMGLAGETPWWGRLLAEPRLAVFAALPCLAAMAPLTALAVAELEVEPTGADQTFWVTDAGQSAAAIEDALGRDGVAGEMIASAGGLKLFALAGFYQRDDARLARAPGRLSGVIGAASLPLGHQ